MKRLAALALALPFAVAGCGDNLKVDVDAAIDARVDAPIDAEIDAPPPPTFSGTVSLQEVKLLNPGNSGTFFGQGPQAAITFTSSADVPGPIMEEMPGSPLGCKAFNVTAAQYDAAVLGVDEGPIQFTVTGGTAPATPPAFPPCVFQAGLGYICPQPGTAQVGGTITAAVNGVASLTDTDVTYTDANSVGRYISISGAAMAANNGVFPIVARPGNNTVAYANPAAVAETLPAAAPHLNLAGVGPTPGAPDPGFLANDSTLAVDHAASAHIAAFTATTAPGTVGDDTGISMNELRKLNAVPLDGTAFTVTCDANCGTASGSILILRTTDAATAGLSPFAMPKPTTKRVEIRCAALGQTSVTVPAAYMALIQSSGATRVQTTFIRPTLMGGAPATVNVIGGHAYVGYTNR
jgi:hypothetical protein